MSIPGSWLRRIIIWFDNFLSRLYHIYPFSDEPDCILRLGMAKSRRSLERPCGKVDPGDDILEIHLWNEHMQPLVASENSIGWGSRTLRLFIRGLRQIAEEIKTDPRLSNIRAIRGEMIFLSTASNPDRGYQMERLGFTVLPFHSKTGAFGEFWENFYSWWLMWAYNPLSVRNRRITTGQRMEMWMSIETFMKKYGTENRNSSTNPEFIRE